MAIGAAYIQVIKRNNFVFNGLNKHNHGCFLLSFEPKKNFFLWNCNIKDQNNFRNNSTLIEQGTVIKFSYLPDSEAIELFVNTFKFRLKAVKGKKADVIQPCIIFTSEEDEVVYSE